MATAISKVTGQFANKPTRHQSNRGLVNSAKRLILNLH